jgi:hypothetical protein
MNETAQPVMDDTLNELAHLAGLSESKLDECGDMGMDQRDTINVSTNMSSDGNKSVNISAQGEKAEELLAMLKLAGMGGTDRPSVMVVDRDEEMMDEAKKDRTTKYKNTPDEEYQSVASITRQGADLNREKRQYAGKPRLGDNPMAESFSLEEHFETLYNSILINGNKDMREGSIKGGDKPGDLTGTWTADPPKKGQPDVPPPVPMDPVSPEAPKSAKQPAKVPGAR